MNFKEIINEIGSKAKKASIKLRTLNADKKKIAYECLEKNIKDKTKDILNANKIDIENAVNNNLAEPLINRLKLNEDSISGIVKSIAEIKNQPDPIGKILEEWSQPNGLRFSKISVPLGVLLSLIHI